MGAPPAARLCCDSAVVCVRRIMHWARRIEQEVDRVFQHITGAQQLRGVSERPSLVLRLQASRVRRAQQVNDIDATNRVDMKLVNNSRSPVCVHLTLVSLTVSDHCIGSMAGKGRGGCWCLQVSEFSTTEPSLYVLPLHLNIIVLVY